MFCASFAIFGLPEVKELDMSKIVIIGAGAVGRVVAHACASQPHLFSDVLLASRRLAACEEIAESVAQKHGLQLQTAEIDAEDTRAVASLLAEFGAQLLIHVALPYQDLTLMDACLEAGTHYLDTANYESRETASFSYLPQWAYRDRFKNAGLTAILGCGFDPGVTGVFTSYAARHYFDEIQSLDIVDCNAGTHTHPFATNFNAEINIREITQDGKYYENGHWHKIAPHSEQRMIDYPGIGPRRSYLIYHEELESLVKHYPTLGSARFWMTFGEEYLRYLRVIMDIGMGGIRPVSFRGQEIVPLEFLQAVLPKGDALAQGYEGETSIGCYIKGIKDGQARTYYIYNNCSHISAYQATGTQAVAFTTGIAAALGARMLLERKWNPGLGVFNVEQCDPDPFMRELAAAGLPWIEEIDGPKRIG